jgi:hypothetical protein
MHAFSLELHAPPPPPRSRTRTRTRTVGCPELRRAVLSGRSSLAAALLNLRAPLLATVDAGPVALASLRLTCQSLADSVAAGTPVQVGVGTHWGAARCCSGTLPAGARALRSWLPWASLRWAGVYCAIGRVALHPCGFLLVAAPCWCVLRAQDVFAQALEVLRHPRLRSVAREGKGLEWVQVRWRLCGVAAAASCRAR